MEFLKRAGRPFSPSEIVEEQQEIADFPGISGHLLCTSTLNTIFASIQQGKILHADKKADHIATISRDPSRGLVSVIT
jgi:hypothetical protein